MPCDPILNNFKSKQFCIFHFNIQGFLNCLDSFQLFLDSRDHEIDVISINEHWLLSENITLLQSLDNFKTADFFARPAQSRGGSCLLVKNNINYKIREDLKQFNEIHFFEGSFIEVKEWNSIFISIYRIPGHENDKIFFKKFERLLEKLEVEARSKHIFIASDTNIDLLNIRTSSKHLMEICDCYGFIANFTDATRSTNSSNTCIDNIFTNYKVSHITNRTLIDLDISDHKALLLTCNSIIMDTASKINKNIKRVRNFSQNNVQKFKILLQNTDWSYNWLKNVNENYNNFLFLFISAFNDSFPNVTKRQTKQPPKCWVTQGIKISANKKKLLHSESKWNMTNKFQNYFKKYKKTFKEVVALSKLRTNDHFITNSDNKTKATWSIIKKELGLSKKYEETPIEVDCVNGNDLQSVVSMANKINNFFVTNPMSISQQGDNQKALKLMKHKHSKLNNSKFTFKPISVHYLTKIIKGLSNKKAVGWDQIPMFIIKSVIDFIKEPLCKIVNQSLEQGIFPNKLKYAEVKPLFKKGDPNEFSNYRPIALLPCFSKIFEKVVKEQLTEYLEDNNLLNQSQFGFRKNMGTKNAISALVDSVSGALDGSERPVGMFYDLSKAFDCVNHGILIDKLRKYGIADKEINWFMSYLDSRKQRIILSKLGSDFRSDWSDMCCGVPQGSILGPCLFILYVNDINTATNTNLFQYADDTALICKGHDGELNNSILKETEYIKNWFSANGLSLNTSKTQIIQFSAANTGNNTNKTLSPNKIEIRDSVKYLGIEIDPHLNWKKQIENLSKRLNSAIFSLRVLRDITNTKTQLSVYHAYFSSIMNYGLLAWGSSAHALKLFKLQKKAVRLIAKVSHRSHCKEWFKFHKILTLTCSYILELACWVKINWKTFEHRLPTHNYGTRQRHLIQPIHHRLQILHRSPQYMAPKVYNKLRPEFKNLVCPIKFRKYLKSWLIEKAFYSLDEFFEEAVVEGMTGFC